MSHVPKARSLQSAGRDQISYPSSISLDDFHKIGGLRELCYPPLLVSFIWFGAKTGWRLVGLMSCLVALWHHASHHTTKYLAFSDLPHAAERRKSREIFCRWSFNRTTLVVYGWQTDLLLSSAAPADLAAPVSCCLSSHLMTTGTSGSNQNWW